MIFIVLKSFTINVLLFALQVLRFHGGAVDVPAIIALVLSKLPLKGDEVEAAMVHEQVMDWALQGHPVVLCPNRTNLAALK